MVVRPNAKAAKTLTPQCDLSPIWNLWDVGKECLDICYPDGSKEHIGNTKRSRAKLIRKAKAMSAIVSFEATGPYEENLADECLAAGVPAVRLDAWKTVGRM